jgi:putative DNA primase/helicase
MIARTLIDPNATPRAMWGYKQFVCWKYVDRGKPKPDKIPINPRNLANAGSTWPNTWTNIRAAVAAYQANGDLAGIAYVLTEHDPYCMIDIDHCIVDDQLSPFAKNVTTALDTYIERSPSGHGLRIFVHCPQQPDAIKRPEIEIYSRERFATLTGDVLNDRPIAKVDSLDWFINEFVPKPEVKATTTHSFLFGGHSTPSGDDQQLWDYICRVNSLAARLYNGDLSAVRGNADPSRAVILLLNSLALHTKGDAARMGRMIHQSRLDQTKWNEKRGNQTWLDGRIQDAIAYTMTRGAR